MKKFLIFGIIIVVFFLFLYKDFKFSCTILGGEYNKAKMMWGFGPYKQPAYCGFNKASDSGRLCYSGDSKDNKTNNDCSSCTYQAYCCIPAADSPC